MIIVAVGSKNKAKVHAVEAAFQGYEVGFRLVDVESGVSEQPFSDEETIQGAINRAMAALDGTGADIGIGLEGGVQTSEHGLFLCNYGALVEKGQPPIISGGARIVLPKLIAERLHAGEELGPIMDDFTKKTDIRSHEGAVGVFTNGQISRKDMFLHVTKLLVGQYEYRKQHVETQF